MTACPHCEAALDSAQLTANCPACGATLEPAAGLHSTRAWLEIRTRHGESSVHLLSGATTIGRSPQATIPIVDPEVSRQHTAVEIEGGQFVVRDLGSSNGTYWNGRRLYAPANLVDRDELFLGTTRILFRIEGCGSRVMRTLEPSAPVLAALSQGDAFAPSEDVPDLATLRRDYDRLRIAHEFQKAIRLERDLPAMLGKILEVAFDLIAAENGVILLRHPQTEELVVEALRQRRASSAKVLISETLLAHVTSRREGVLTNDASADLRFHAASSIVGLGVRSCMAVPLLAGDQVRGVMFLDSREYIGAFTLKDLEVLSAIAAQAAVAIRNADLLRAVEAAAEKKAFLERFLSPALAREVEKGRIELAKGGTLKELAVLFADIRGFTALSENASPHETVELLNEYFELMADCVFEFNGIVDKFIGDAVMALFGAPMAGTDDAERAIRCALRMLEKAREFNTAREAAGRAPIAIGIGLHVGEAVVGVIGSTKRLEYTAIGDTVNVASRLCDAAMGNEVVLSDAALERSREKFAVESLDVMQVKGREATLKTYRLRLSDR